MKQHIYAALASRRRQLGLSQHELAVRAGLRREKVNRLENKAEDIGVDDLCRLLDAVGLRLVVSKKDENAADLAHGSSAPRSAAVPRDFREASFIDGSKVKVLDWGKLS
jgi:transcriptional regulator with XRE-family HTH domain